MPDRNILDFLSDVLRESSDFVQNPSVIKQYDGRAFKPLNREETSSLLNFFTTSYQNQRRVEQRCAETLEFDKATGIKNLISDCRNTFYKQGGEEIDAKENYSTAVYERLAEGLRSLREIITRTQGKRQTFQRCARTIYGEQIVQMGVICAILYQKNNFNQHQIVPDYLKFFTVDGFFGYDNNATDWNINAWAALAESAVSKGFAGASVIERIDGGILIGETAKMILGIAPIVRNILRNFGRNQPTSLNQLDDMIRADIARANVAANLGAIDQERNNNKIFQSIRSKIWSSIISDETSRLEKRITKQITSRLPQAIGFNSVSYTAEDIRKLIQRQLTALDDSLIREIFERSPNDVARLVGLVHQNVGKAIAARQKSLEDVLLEYLNNSNETVRSSEFRPIVYINDVRIKEDDEGTHFRPNYLIVEKSSAKQVYVRWGGRPIPSGAWGTIHVIHGNLRTDIRIKSIDHRNGLLHFRFMESFSIPVNPLDNIHLSIVFDGFEDDTAHCELTEDIRNSEFVFFNAKGKTCIDSRTLLPKYKSLPIGSYALVRDTGTSTLFRIGGIPMQILQADVTCPEGFRICKFFEATTVPRDFLMPGSSAIDIVDEPEPKDIAAGGDNDEYGNFLFYCNDDGNGALTYQLMDSSNSIASVTVEYTVAARTVANNGCVLWTWKIPKLKYLPQKLSVIVNFWRINRKVRYTLEVPAGT